MNQETSTKPAIKHIVSISTNNLLAFNALLEQINQAARVGKLDFDDRSIEAELIFLEDVKGQTAAPLEAVIDAQDHILGIACSIKQEPFDLGQSKRNKPHEPRV
jgi:hypothetical protein